MALGSGPHQSSRRRFCVHQPKRALLGDRQLLAVGRERDRQHANFVSQASSGFCCAMSQITTTPVEPIMSAVVDPSWENAGWSEGL